MRDRSLAPATEAQPFCSICGRLACGLRYMLNDPKPGLAEDLLDLMNVLSGGRLRAVIHSSGRSEEENHRAVWVNYGEAAC